MSVVNLKHIDLATTEDKESKLDHWARLFKAKTWEEIKMIAKNSEYLSEASKTLYEMNADDRIREQCLYRQEREKREHMMTMRIQELTEENTKVIETNARITEENAKITEENARLHALLAEHNTDTPSAST